MNFSCFKEDLSKAVSIVERSVGSKNSLPVMGNILIETLENEIKLSANNLEIGMEVTIPARIETPGKVLAPAKTLGSIVSKLPNDEVTVEVMDNQVINISCNQSKFNIHGMEADEFLKLSYLSEGTTIEIDANNFKDMIKHVIFSVSNDESKHILNGVYFEFAWDDESKDKIRLVSTDGYRLALKEGTISNIISEKSTFVIPTKALNEISGVISGNDDEKIIIKVHNDQVSFAYKNNYLITRIIQGQFPDFNQVIPQSSASTIIINKKDLLSASERCAIIASTSANIIKLENDGTKLLISAKTPDVGEVSELIDVEVIGEDKATVSFNVKLIIDSLKIINDEKIELNLTGSYNPGLLKVNGRDDYKYVIMPIRTNG